MEQRGLKRMAPLGVHMLTKLDKLRIAVLHVAMATVTLLYVRGGNDGQKEQVR